MQFFDLLNDVFRARFPVVMLHTHESDRVYRGIKKFCKEDEYTLYKWNCVEGMVELGLTFDTVLPVGDGQMDAIQVLVEIERRMDMRDKELFVLEGMYDWIYKPHVKMLLRKLANDLIRSVGPKSVVLMNPVPELPLELSQVIPVLRVPPAEGAALQALLAEVAKALGKEVDPAVAAKMVQAASGMNMQRAELAFRLAGVTADFGRDATMVVQEVRSWKAERIEDYART